MAENSLEVLVTTVADTSGATATTAALDEMSGKAQAQATKNVSAFEKFNKSLSSVSDAAVKVGTSMTTYVSLPIAGVAFESAKMAMSFEQTMEMLHTNAGTAQADIKGLSDEILKMAPQVGAGPEALATAMYHIASAGNGMWDTAKQLDILKTAAEGAAIGQANLDDTTYALTSALSSNVKGAKDASEMMATLNAIVGSGDMKLQGLNAAIGTGFLGTAATFGISIQSVGAALATLTDNGEGADAAATRLRMTWALMTSPSKQAAKLMADLGVSADGAQYSTDQMNTVFAKTGLTTTRLATDLQQPNGINVALKDLKTHLVAAGMTAPETDALLSKMFGGGRTDSALLTMLQNMDRVDVKYQAINKGTKQFSDNWAAQQKVAKQQFEQAWAGIQASLIKLGTDIMPNVLAATKGLNSGITGLSKWFEGLNDGQKQFAINALGIVAVAGPVLIVLGTLGKSVSNIINLTTLVGPAFLKMAGAAIGATDALIANMTGGTGVVSALQTMQEATGVSGLMMAGVFAGLVIDVMLVYNAVKTVTGAFDAMNAANKSAQNAQNAKAQEKTTILGLIANGTPEQKLNASTIYRKDFGNSFAKGTDYAPGGLSLVGEEGPEIMNVPQGASIIPANRTQQLLQGISGGNSTHQEVHIGQVIIQSAQGAHAFFDQLDQDALNISRGLTPVRGAY